MFLRQINTKLRAVCVQSVQNYCSRVLSGKLGSYESELIEKWRRKLEDEKVPEIDVSLEHILDHILDKDKVWTELAFTKCKYEFLMNFPFSVTNFDCEENPCPDWRAIGTIRAIVRVSCSQDAHSIHHWRMGFLWFGIENGTARIYSATRDGGAGWIDIAAIR